MAALMILKTFQAFSDEAYCFVVGVADYLYDSFVIILEMIEKSLA